MEVVVDNKKTGKEIFHNPDKDIKIVESKASQIEFEDFSNGDITLKKPKG